ncbi:hypothetical protein C8Q74DRAFT_1253377 [Fomes fomentarius]|nr:hypothetical protein C8Q74DRAFT_1253377 [Fomes fomentarius]
MSIVVLSFMPLFTRTWRSILPVCLLSVCVFFFREDIARLVQVTMSLAVVDSGRDKYEHAYNPSNSNEYQSTTFAQRLTDSRNA